MVEETIEDAEFEEVEEEVEPTPEEAAREISEAAWDEHTEEAGEGQEQILDHSAADAVEEAPEEEPIVYPSGWSAEIREQMAQAPADFQKWAVEWTKATHAKSTQTLQEAARVRNSLNSLVETIKPYEKQIRAEGETPEQRIGYLLALDERIEADPVGAIHQICQEVGIHPSQIVGQQMHPQPPNGYPQQMPEVSPELMQIRQELNQWKQQAAEREYQQVKQGVTGLVEQWASQTGDDGRPLRPYFNNVQQQMAAMIPGITNANPTMPHEQVLAIAYNASVQGSPTVLEAQKRYQEQVERAAKARAAKAAKRAGSSVKGGREGKAAAAGHNKTRREIAEAAWEQFA
jgi:hypothetical protein